MYSEEIAGRLSADDQRLILVSDQACLDVFWWNGDAVAEEVQDFLHGAGADVEFFLKRRG